MDSNIWQLYEAWSTKHIESLSIECLVYTLRSISTMVYCGGKPLSSRLEHVTPHYTIEQDYSCFEFHLKARIRYTTLHHTTPSSKPTFKAGFPLQDKDYRLNWCHTMSKTTIAQCKPTAITHLMNIWPLEIVASYHEVEPSLKSCVYWSSTIIIIELTFGTPVSGHCVKQACVINNDLSI